MIVDTPGYGYVFAPVKLKEKWSKMMFKYLGYGVRINMIVLLVNGHIGLKQNDLKMLDDLSNLNKPVQVVLSKVDKVKSSNDLMRITAETTS
jgi:GTP-binding protein